MGNPLMMRMEVGEESFSDKDGGGVGSLLVMRMKVVKNLFSCPVLGRICFPVQCLEETRTLAVILVSDFHTIVSLERKILHTL